jgi:hypothetical protein
MNKVNWIELGGAPIRNDDWKFDQDAVRDALKGVSSFLGANALLNGCVPSPSGGGHVFTSGYVLINGEVLFVPAVTAPIPFDEDGNYFQIQESNVSPDGDIVMENGNAVNIYKQRIAVIGYDSDSLPPNAITWLSAYNNRFTKKAYDAVMSETIFPQKGMFWKRLSGAPLTISSGIVDFDSRNGNFARVTTNNSTLQDINLSLSGGLQPILFALKVVGTGWLKIQHGGIVCPDARNHYFKQNDIVMFMSDGGSPTSVTHLLSIGDADSGWHTVGASGEPAYAVGVTGNLRFKKEGNYVVLDGVINILPGFNELVFTFPISCAPLSLSLFNIVSLVATGASADNSGELRVYGTPPSGSVIFITNVRIPLD